MGLTRSRGDGGVDMSAMGVKQRALAETPLLRSGLGLERSGVAGTNVDGWRSFV